jgi:parallel beta-helix repeat protein
VESADRGPCIEIRASDVILDGRGHAVAGPGATTGGTPAATDRAGVVATGRNVTVRNLTVTDWRVGVALDGVTDGVIRGVTADANGEGVVVAASSRVTVADGLARDADAFSGVAVVNSRRVVVRTVTVGRSRFDGVSVADSRNVTVADVVARNNTRAGVTLAGATGSRIADSRAVRNGHVGVGLFGADGNALAGNNVTGTRAATGAFALPAGGIVLVNASRNRVARTETGGNAV